MVARLVAEMGQQANSGSRAFSNVAKTRQYAGEVDIGPVSLCYLGCIHLNYTIHITICPIAACGGGLTKRYNHVLFTR